MLEMQFLHMDSYMLQYHELLLYIICAAGVGEQSEPHTIGMGSQLVNYIIDEVSVQLFVVLCNIKVIE